MSLVFKFFWANYLHKRVLPPNPPGEWRASCLSCPRHESNCQHYRHRISATAPGFMSAIAMLIQKTEKPEGNLIPQHILLVSRGNETIDNAGNLLAVL